MQWLQPTGKQKEKEWHREASHSKKNAPEGRLFNREFYSVAAARTRQKLWSDRSRTATASPFINCKAHIAVGELGACGVFGGDKLNCSTSCYWVASIWDILTRHCDNTSAGGRNGRDIL